MQDNKLRCCDNGMIKREDLKKLTSEEKDEIIIGLQEEVLFLRQALSSALERIKALEDQLAKNSRNSGKPPSSDGLKKPNPKSLRGRGKRKTGGQKGHEGRTLFQVETPDVVVTHAVKLCGTCARSLIEIAPSGIERRQEFELPPLQPIITEHQAEIKVCPHCGCQTKETFPEGITHPVQYGPRVKGMASYFSTHQLLPFGRLKELFEDVFQLSLSEGTLFNVGQTGYDNLEEYESVVREQLIENAVVHFDESGLRVVKTLNWLHVASTEKLTHYEIHGKRGREAMDEIGILPHFKGVAIHDHWKPYFHYGKKHGLCNAHHLRELIYQEEQYGQLWAGKLRECLLEIKTEVDEHIDAGKTQLDPTRLRYFSQKYSRILRGGLKEIPVVYQAGKKGGKPKQHPAKNLLDRLRDFKRETLAFMCDFTVPFTNNRSEQDIRMIKVKQKISGCFRSQQGGKVFCRIRGYVSTVRKNSLNALEALTDVFRGAPFLPSSST